MTALPPCPIALARDSPARNRAQPTTGPVEHPVHVVVTRSLLSPGEDYLGALGRGV